MDHSGSFRIVHGSFKIIQDHSGSFKDHSRIVHWIIHMSIQDHSQNHSGSFKIIQGSFTRPFRIIHRIIQDHSESFKIIQGSFKDHSLDHSHDHSESFTESFRIVQDHPRMIHWSCVKTRDSIIRMAWTCVTRARFHKRTSNTTRNATSKSTTIPRKS